MITIQTMDPDVIAEVINNSEKRKKIISQTMDLIEKKNLDGVNVDFEYAGTPSVITTRNFTQFIIEFRKALDAVNPEFLLSVDVFADSSSKLRIWDIENIHPHVNQIIIMAYDFHRAGSSIAAPISPIRGAPEFWQYDISKTLSDFSRVSPLDKLVLGVPYYGYEWKTVSREKYASTYPNSGALATYRRIQQLITDKNPEMDWDETALSPRLTYTEKGNIYQICYENEVSLGLKYDLINESGLAGAGIWALGYDGNYPNLWNLLQEKFNSY